MIGIIQGVLGLGKVWLEGRQEVSKQKSANKRAELEARSAAKQKAMENEAAWEKYQAQGAMSSWKDEAWTLFFIAIPIFMLVSVVWFPELQQPIESWIAWMADLGLGKEFFMYGAFASIAASFGLKSIAKMRR